MMSEAHRQIDGSNHPNLCKPSHSNHRCSVWARQSRDNYLWLFRLYTELCAEYQYRYGKPHKTLFRRRVLSVPPVGLRSVGMTEFAQAMPDEFKNADPVTAYRVFYLVDKSRFATWTRRPPPLWWPDRTVKPDLLRRKRLANLPLQLGVRKVS